MDEKNGYDQQLSLRGDGKIPIISIEADNLAEATHNAIIACHDYGVAGEAPKHKPGMPLGRDANILVRVENPDSEPKICSPGLQDAPLGTMQYILEVTHGIHNNWKKCEEHPDWWGYTYHERFIDQIPFVLKRIKHDWDEKKGQWHKGKGRPSGRDYQFAIWRAGEDIILEQPDAPCWQLGQLRLLQDKEGDLVLNYATNWRSRDLFKAWNQNNIGQIELMKCFRNKIQDMLQTEIKLGSYIDHSDSLHLYGLYYERDNLEETIKNMKRDGYEARSMSLENYFLEPKKLKGIIAAQMCAEYMDDSKNLPEKQLKKIGYDINNFTYPKVWDSWDPRFDAKPDEYKLAKVGIF